MIGVKSWFVHVQSQIAIEALKCMHQSTFSSERLQELVEKCVQYCVKGTTFFTHFSNAFAYNMHI